MSEALEIGEECGRNCKDFCAAWALIRPENQSTKFEYGIKLSGKYGESGILDLDTLTGTKSSQKECILATEDAQSRIEACAIGREQVAVECMRNNFNRRRCAWLRSHFTIKKTLEILLHFAD